MTPSWPHLSDLVADALALDAEARIAFLDANVADPALRAEVEALTHAHDSAAAEGALESPFQAPSLPGPVGPWRPTARLGAGGMGVVYAAERTGEGFVQRAALKLARPGFGGDFRARFLRERAVLAGLGHPGIARLLDGGLSGGLPYLAMELVEGQPITAYADAHGLDLRDRLGLFLQACDAVAHAHRHLVVHRDLKPDHVLVVEAERGAASVKILDFGIAKLLDDAADGLGGARVGGAGALITRTGTGPLTPQYAAPEQLMGRPVTTATDVYALGLVLYELLTGRRPYEVTGLTPSEAARVVAETAPARPSDVSRAAAREATGLGETGAMGPSRTRGLRGDLDTVVMKALAKEPERRYASAEALGDDLRRFLDDRPVVARPDTWAYRTRTFVRRQRVGVAAATAGLAALVVGAGAALWQAGEARAEAARATTETAKAEAVQDFLVGMLGAASPGVDGRDVRVADLLDRAAASLDTAFADQPGVRADAHTRLGRTYLALGLLDDADAQLRRALEILERSVGPDAVATADAQLDLGSVRHRLGDPAAADSLFSLALATTQKLFGEADPRTAILHAQRATLRFDAGDYTGAAEAYRRVLAIEEAIYPPGHIETLTSIGNLAVALSALGVAEEATALLERQAGLLRQHHPTAGHDLANALANLGASYVDQRRYEDAAAVQAEAVSLFRSALGDDHPDLGFGLNNLGSTLTLLERPSEAEPLLREAIAIYRAALGERHPNVGYPLVNLAKALRDLGRLEGAERAITEAETLLLDGFGPDHPALVRVAELRGSIAERRAGR